MWIYLPDCFLSIVDSMRRGYLLVRARKKGDIERLFPKALVTEQAGSDYKYRSVIRRDIVAKTISVQIAAINYRNFKDEVKDKSRHMAYMRTWNTMVDWQDENDK